MECGRNLTKMKIKYITIIVLFVSLLTGCTQSTTNRSIKKLKATTTSSKIVLKKIDDKAPNTQLIYDENSPLTKLDVYPDTWSATDSLGRALPSYNEVGDVKQDKFVGLFFWTWHVSPFTDKKPQNNNDIILQNPGEKNNFDFVGWGKNTTNYWNEPIYGYYNSTDKYVLRKQAELLAYAGVDVIFFDATNGSFTWKPAYTALMEVFTEARAQGVKTPQIAFMLNFGAIPESVVSLKSIYEDIYKAEKNKDLWFYWDGKPLIMAYPDNLKYTDPLEQEIKDFFTFRPGQPLLKDEPLRDDQWGWLGIYPQKKFGVNNGILEETSVGVSQNWSKEAGLTAMNGENVFGRSYSDKNGFDKRPQSSLYGINFQEQWDYAISLNPEFIFITGWNEWTASRFEKWQDVPNAFPDEFNDEFSRDIEPSKGELNDNYYYQMVSNIRTFKGVRPLPAVSAPKTINILDNTDQWADVIPEFKHYEGSIPARNSFGHTIKYTNNTGRNDVVSSKVTYDNDNIYFMVETAVDLTPKTDPAWMRLLIDTPVTTDKNWEGFEFVVNRNNPGDRASLEICDGGWNWIEVGQVDYTVSGRRLQISIPRKMLGLTDKLIDFNFKWSDNMQEDGNLRDFYVNGEAAPGGRFTFHYLSEVKNVVKTNNVFANKSNVWKMAIGAGTIIAVGISAIIIIMKKKHKV